MKKFKMQHVWLILGAYGVWFAIFSGLEEVGNGKYWKAGLSLLFGVFVYLMLEKRLKSN